MEAKARMDADTIERLIELQRIDRVRDRLQKRLDEVPVRLKKYTDALASYDRALAEQRQLARAARAEADRAELEVRAKEEERDKYKRQMNAPKLTNREYKVLQEGLAGVIADIRSLEDKAVKALQHAEEAEAKAEEVQQEAEELRAEYTAAKEKLEGSLSGVRDELAQRDAERQEFVAGFPDEPLRIYERVRRKHKDAMAVVDGTIDRAAGRIGSDLHCAACYMAITANDAVKVLGRKMVVRCKSCARILYVP